MVISASAMLFARTPEKGAETLVWLATSPEAAKYSGEYFHDLKVAKTTARAKDDALAAQLWEMTEKLTKEQAETLAKLFTTRDKKDPSSRGEC